MSVTATTLAHGIGMTSQRTRERLIRRIDKAGVRNPTVLDALRQVPRHLFVDEALASRAYEDCALPIGHGQTISQPYTVARMTEALLDRDFRRPCWPLSSDGSTVSSGWGTCCGRRSAG
jgi:protein-L-isoaspartate(D-aspartate) O-methyltransferase